MSRCGSKQWSVISNYQTGKRQRCHRRTSTCRDVLSRKRSARQAQAQLPALLRKIGNDLIVITRRDKTVAYLISAQRMEAIVETLEVIADPEAMRAVRRARTGIVYEVFAQGIRDLLA
jgi:PHD/YefM family antitoxin component YafN of YafNO toxin-antitoxin module